MSSSRPLSLEALTIADASPPELVEIAAGLGCDFISLFLASPAPGLAVPELLTDTPLRRETMARLAGTGVRVRTVECFAIMPDSRVEDWEPVLEAGAVLGATCATAIVFDDEPARQVETFARLAERAGAHGMALNLEFLAFCPVPTLAAAAALIVEAGQPNAGIVVDSLHITRSGSPISDIVAHAGLIGAAQICDGPPVIADDLVLYEGSEQRLVPGAGSFDLAGFLGALPPGLPLGVEVPQKDLRYRGVPAADRARLAVEATRRMISAIEPR